MDWGLIFSFWGTLGAAFFGAKYGAKYSYELQKAKEHEDNKRKNVASGNIAIFNLSLMVNALLVYQKQIIDPVRKSNIIMFDLRPTLETLNHGAIIDVESLHFILESAEPSLLGELAVENRRHLTAIAAINERSRCYRNEVQPLLERAGIREGQNYLINDIRVAIGDRLWGVMETSTKEIIAFVDSTILSHKQVADKLKRLLQTLYPNNKFISFVIQN